MRNISCFQCKPNVKSVNNLTFLYLCLDAFISERREVTSAVSACQCTCITAETILNTSTPIATTKSDRNSTKYATLKRIHRHTLIHS